jgi:hypothetical protein
MWDVMGAIITAGVTLFGYLYIQSRSRARELEEAHRPEKIRVYDHFLSIVGVLQIRAKEKPTNERKKEIDPRTLQDFREFSRGLIVWGSPAVIKQYMKFSDVVRQLPKDRENSGSPKGKIRSKELLLAMDDVLRAFRVDLGLSCKDLKRGELIALLLSDPKELMGD